LNPSSDQITLILDAINRGETDGAETLMRAVYESLRRLAAAKVARQRAGYSLQATELVHEAWMRLVDSDGRARFDNRAHFFAAASEAMRRILVDHARRKLRMKRGGGAEHCDVNEVEIAAPMDNHDELLAVNEALDRLAAKDPRKAELVKLRYFVGLSFEEAAEVLGVSVPTANRYWAYARAWLHAEISRAEKEGGGAAG
jgi:RNA polymerase sigma factor (TIGR02999 family)